MPLYVLNRDFTLRSTSGHSIAFEKGVPVNVPPVLEQEAAQYGAERVDGVWVDPIEPSKLVAEVPEALAASDREVLLTAAFEQIIKRNDSKDFTGQGIPTVNAIKAIVGFTVERAEIGELWFSLREKAAI